MHGHAVHEYLVAHDVEGGCIFVLDLETEFDISLCTFTRKFIRLRFDTIHRDVIHLGRVDFIRLQNLIGNETILPHAVLPVLFEAGDLLADL